jgi:hypothetical protein
MKLRLKRALHEGKMLRWRPEGALRGKIGPFARQAFELL